MPSPQGMDMWNRGTVSWPGNVAALRENTSYQMLELDMWYWNIRSGGASGLGTLSSLVGIDMEFSHNTAASFCLSIGTRSLLPAERAIPYIKGQQIILLCQRLRFLISEGSIITSSVAKRWLAARLDYRDLKCLSQISADMSIQKYT